MENKVQIKDYSRIKRFYIMGLILYIIFSVVLIVFFSNKMINNNTMLIFTVISVVLLFIYMFVVYVETNKTISVEQFSELFSDYPSNEIENILFDSGFNEDEITKIIKKMKPNENIEIKEKIEQSDNIYINQNDYISIDQNDYVSTDQNDYIYCQNCGKENLKDTNFCTGCGNRLNENYVDKNSSKLQSNNIIFIENNLYGKYVLYDDHMECAYRTFGFGSFKEYYVKYDDIIGFDMLFSGTIPYKYFHIEVKNGPILDFYTRSKNANALKRCLLNSIYKRNPHQKLQLFHKESAVFKIILMWLITGFFVYIFFSLIEILSF